MSVRALSLLLLVSLSSMVSSVAPLLLVPQQTENFEEPGAPVFMGEFAGALPTFSGELTVVSYNIRYGEQIDRAIADLLGLEALAGADILLLQEMDHDGSERIAQALGMNYVYAPASIHTYHEREFGNAILSRWPLSAGDKLILPNPHPATNQMRTATKAVTHVGGREIHIYSTHTETILTLPEHRREQFAALAADVAPEADLVIVGGDFNTVSSGQVVGLADELASAGLLHASAGSGPTVSRYNIQAQADHLFSAGFQFITTGVANEALASDHKPVWVQLRTSQ